MSGSTSLKEYLRRYQSDGGGNDGKKKRKKKKKDLKTKSCATAGVFIVDEDPTWHKLVNVDDEADENSSDDRAVVVEEDVEVKRLRRLQMLQAKKPYYSVSEDGSGWVSVSDLRDKVGNACGSFGVSDFGTQDLSPLRQQGSGRHFDTPSPEQDVVEVPSPTRRSEDGDLSPPRKNQRDSLDAERNHMSPVGFDMSPPRRKKDDFSGDDVSPAQWVRKSSGRHDSPKLDVCHGSPWETDLLPPKRNIKGSIEDHSPLRWCRHDSPETRMNYVSSSEADLSSPRRNRKGLSDNFSLTQGGQRSPTRKFSVEIHGLEPDISPPRKSRRISNDDISLPRRKGMDQQHFPEQSNVQRSLSTAITPLQLGKTTQPSTTEEHRKGGLFTRGEIKDVIDKKKAKDVSRLAALDHTKSGVAAEPVYRVKGKRVTKEEKMKLEKGEEKQKEVKLEWGKGIAQKREAEARKMELELEKDKPFARTRDDPELEKMLKEKLRWGDPMAHLVKKKHTDIHLEDFGVDEKMKDSGFIIPQAVPSHSWIKRGIDPPPNRYNIKPGRHWDGVDRSTGYEKELFKRQNEKKANQTEAYLWSVTDM